MQFLHISIPGLDSDLLHRIADTGSLVHLGGILDSGSLLSYRSSQPLATESVSASLFCATDPETHALHAAYHPSGRSWFAQDLRSPALWHVLAEAGYKTATIGCPGTYGGRLKNGIHIPQLFGAPGFMASPRVLKQCNADGVSLPGLVDAWVGVDQMPTDIVRWIMGGSGTAFSRVSRDHGQFFLNHVAHSVSLHCAAQVVIEQFEPTALIVTYPLLERLSPYLAYIDGQGERSEQENPFVHTIPRALKLLDQFIGALLCVTGPETTVCITSEYGYWTHSSGATESSMADARKEVRPWNRGWAAMRGPNLKADAVATGARIYDVVPTLGAAMGLPMSAKMRGRAIKALLGFAVGSDCNQSLVELRDAHFVPNFSEPALIDDVAEALLSATDGYTSSSSGHTGMAGQESFDLRWQNLQSRLESAPLAEVLPDIVALSEDYPESLNVAVAVILSMLRLGLVAQARSYALALLDDYPDIALAQVLVARCDYDAGEVVGAFDRLLEVDQLCFISDWEELVARAAMAQVYSDAGDYAAAIHQLRRLVEMAPASARAHRGLSNVSLQLGLLEEAEVHIDTALVLDSQSSEGYALRANLLVARGDYQQAIPILENCLDMALPEAEVLRTLIQVHKLKGDLPSSWWHRKERLDALECNQEVQSPVDSTSVNVAVDTQRALDDEQLLDNFADWTTVPEVQQQFTVVTGLDTFELQHVSDRLAADGIVCSGMTGADFYHPLLDESFESPAVLEDLVGQVLILPARLLGRLSDLHRYDVHWLNFEQANEQLLKLCRSGLQAGEELDDMSIQQLLLGLQAVLKHRTKSAFHMKLQQFQSTDAILQALRVSLEKAA